MYYVIKIRISLNYADVNFTMNSLCNETVKRYISSVVINLSASPLSTMAAQYCAKEWERVYKESCRKLSGLLETKCVKGEVQLVSKGKLPATLVLYVSPLDTPNDEPVLESAPKEADHTHLPYPWQSAPVAGVNRTSWRKGVRNLIHF